ncbi:MAG: phosphatase PAP2 family protein [Acidimicrobiia bacterium]|nr:phosphatase PAP2 family protein [Acidimicrobiia bacterium]
MRIPAPTRRPVLGRVRYGWILEAVIGIVLYLLYDELRSAVSGSARAALHHGFDVVRWERAVGLYQEYRVQQAFLDAPVVLSLANIYYGTVHFIMPVVALVMLWRRAPERYLRWRNTLLVMLTIALVMFWLYPLNPPRLMPARYGFVDTAAEYFNFGPQQRIVVVHGIPTAASRAAFGNLFAAMPSLHVGWSTWSALALLPVVRRRWVRVLIVVDPVLTVFAIVVTGNHWILDAVGGWIVLFVSWLIVVGLASTRDRLRPAPRVTPG